MTWFTANNARIISAQLITDWDRFGPCQHGRSLLE